MGHIACVAFLLHIRTGANIPLNLPPRNHMRETPKESCRNPLEWVLIVQTPRSKSSEHPFSEDPSQFASAATLEHILHSPSTFSEESHGGWKVALLTTERPQRHLGQFQMCSRFPFYQTLPLTLNHIEITSGTIGCKEAFEARAWGVKALRVFRRLGTLRGAQHIQPHALVSTWLCIRSGWVLLLSEGVQRGPAFGCSFNVAGL